MLIHGGGDGVGIPEHGVHAEKWVTRVPKDSWRMCTSIDNAWSGADRQQSQHGVGVGLEQEIYGTNAIFFSSESTTCI